MRKCLIMQVYYPNSMSPPLLCASAWPIWWPTLPTTVSDLVCSARSGSRCVLMCATEVCILSALSSNRPAHCTLLKQRFSVLRRERARVGPDTLRRSGDDSGSFPRGAAPPPTAGQWQQQRRLLHAAGLGSQLETTRRDILTLSHTGHTLPAQLAHALPPHSSHAGGGGELAAVAAAAVRVAGDSAQRGPVRQRGSGNRRWCCFGALTYPIRSSTGKRWNETENDTRNHQIDYFEI